MDVPFNLAPPETARLEEVAPGIRRLVAGNAGPFTFTGTCTYLVGRMTSRSSILARRTARISRGFSRRSAMRAWGPFS